MSARPAFLRMRFRQLAGDVHERVDVRPRAEAPHEARACQTPVAPRLLVVRLPLLVERHRQLLHPAVRLDDLHHLVAVLLAVRSHQFRHHLLRQLLLLLRHVGVGQTGDGRVLLRHLHAVVFVHPLARQHRGLALVGAQRAEQVRRGLGLLVEDVVLRVAAGAVTVVQRAAERGRFLGVAVAADGDVVAAEHQRELLALDRFAVDQRADGLEVAAGVEPPVAAQLLVALFAVGDRVEDLVEQFDLLLVVLLADLRLAVRGVVGQQAGGHALPVGDAVVPGADNLLLLVAVHALEQLEHHRLGLGLLLGAGSAGLLQRGQPADGGNGRGGAEHADEVAATDRHTGFTLRAGRVLVGGQHETLSGGGKGTGE